MPDVRWVLIGDDGEHDPQLYRSLASEAPEKVAAIALRQVPRSRRRSGAAAGHDVEGVPFLRGADGNELLSQARAATRRP
jgi:phosphatidate phosphatase APP1